MRIRAAALLALLAATGTSACGATERADDAAAVAERFHAALADGDGEAACAELSEDTAGELESQEDEPCPDAVLALDLPRGGQADRVQVYVRNALVTLTRGGADFLDEGSRGWKVSAAACRRSTPDQPYECELEG